MLDAKTIYQRTTKEYLERIGKLDLRQVSMERGAVWGEEGVTVPLLGRFYRVTPTHILDSQGKEPDHAIRVVLCQYLLYENPNGSDSREWVSFKDFSDAAPLAEAFRNNAEKAVADDFAKRQDALVSIAGRVSGVDAHMPWSYDLTLRFDALPRVPILLLFNDSDEDFAAQCIQLFQRCVEKYLDMESLAILGWVLADYLRGIRPIPEEEM